jgi:hypothetical protein
MDPTSLARRCGLRAYGDRTINLCFENDRRLRLFDGWNRAKAFGSYLQVASDSQESAMFPFSEMAHRVGVRCFQIEVQ